MTFGVRLSMAVMTASAIAGTILRLSDPSARLTPFTMLTIGAALWMAIELAAMGDRREDR